MQPSISPKPELGSLFPTIECGWSEEDQRRVHKSAAITDLDRQADPFLLALGCIQQIGEMLVEHLPQLGPVITRQTLTINDLPVAGAPAFANGQVTRFDNVPRGIAMDTDFRIASETGQNFLILKVALLLIDPEKSIEGKRGSTKRLPTDENDPIKELGTFRFSPDIVKAFDHGNPPSLHTEPSIAMAAGFPKPIVAGNQIFGIIWNKIVRPAYQLPVTLGFTLGRPVFWDDEVSFVRVPPVQDEHMRLEVRTEEQKIAISGEVFGEPKL